MTAAPKRSKASRSADAFFAKDAVAIRSEKGEKFLLAALDGEDPRPLYDFLIRSSRMPGPHPNVELAQAVGARIAEAGRRGAELTRELLGHAHSFCIRTGLMVLATRASNPKDSTGAIDLIHDQADAPEKDDRDAVVATLVQVIAARGNSIVPHLARFTDGFIHSFVALEALSTRSSLDSVSDSEGVLARLSEAFDLADQSSRADERAQGVRLLRESLPTHIARFAGRYPETYAWLEARFEIERPESRLVLEQALGVLKKGGLAIPEYARLLAGFEAHNPVPRDPTRVVKGMRRRGKVN